MDDFATIGREVKQRSGAYADIDDATLGQLYLKKTNPLQYEIYQKQIGANIQSQKELDVARQKREEEFKFEQEHQVPSAAEEEVERKEAGAKEVIDQLFEIYYGKEGEKSLALTEPGKYRLPAQLKALETKFKAGKANSVEQRIYEYNRILESKRAKLAKAAGDAGNLALQEQILAGKGLPGVDATPGEAVTLFASAYDAFAGGQRPERLEGFLKEEKQVGNGGLPPIEAARPAGVGGLLGAGAKALKFLFPNIAALPGQAVEQTRALAQGDIQAQERARQDALMSIFGPLGSPSTRAAAKEGLTTLTLARLIPGIFGKGRRAIAPIKTAKGARLAETQALEKTGEGIGSKSLQTTARGMLKAKIATIKEVPFLKKLAAGEQVKPTEALKFLVKAGQKSFTKSGDPRITKAADFYSLLREGLREEFTKKAPKVIEETTRIAKALPQAAFRKEPIARGLAKIFSPVTIGAGIAGGAASGVGISLLQRLGLLGGRD